MKLWIFIVSLSIVEKKMNHKTYNTLYNCCISNPWLKVVEKLDEELNLNPVYFIGWDDGSHKITEKYEKCFFHQVDKAWLGMGFPDIKYNFDISEELIQSISFEKSLAIKMMDRFDLGRGNFSYTNREIFFYQLLKYWLTIVEEYDINIIISPSVPHRVFDYVLYIVAKIKNINFLMFQMTPFTDSSFLLDDIQQTPKYLKTYMQDNIAQEPLHEHIQQRLNQVRGEYKDAIPSFMIEQQNRLNSQNFIKNNVLRIKNFIHNPIQYFDKDDSYYVIEKDSIPSNKKDLQYHKKIKKHSNKNFLNNLKKDYESFSIEPNYNQKYLFLALHYQPEETTMPTGGLFSSQELIVELLNNFLDDDYFIYIKEHKTQFDSNAQGAMGRHKDYYKNILSISNRIKFITLKTEPFKLIDNAVATVTISGTVGWESAIRGTPTIIFGRAWYEDMPGIFKVKSIKDIHNNWKDILHLKGNISTQSIDNYHQNIQNFFIDAAHYKAFVNKVDRTEKENALNIVNGISKHLNQINFFNVK